MAKFVTVYQLEDVCPSDIYAEKEFALLKQLHKYFRHRAAEFWVKNNFYRHTGGNIIISCAALRIYFRDIWQWHVPEEIHSIVEYIEHYHFSSPSRPGECLLMLKRSEHNGIPEYFCDVLFFWSKGCYKPDWSLICSEVRERENVDRAEVLISCDGIPESLSELRDLCAPGNDCILWECEFCK